MKKLFVLCLFICCSVVCFGEQVNDITASFKFWLLNNEAKVMSSINADRKLSELILSPFSIIPDVQQTINSSEKQLWKIHRKYYVLLGIIQKIYSQNKRFASGKFAVTLKQARPEIWMQLPIQTALPAFPGVMTYSLRQGWCTDLLKVLDIDPTKDYNADESLKAAVDNLTGDEKRILDYYFECFSSLYPSNKTAKLIKSIMDYSKRSSVSKRVKEIISLTGLNTSSFNEEESPEQTIDNTLEQLEELAGFTEEDNIQVSQPQKFTEEPSPDIQDEFNIW